MAYILVDPKVLESKGISYEKMPDGRAIAETNILKVLGSVSNVEFVSTTKELNDMVEAQKKELEKKAENEHAQVVPENADSVPEGQESLPDKQDAVPDDQSTVPEQEVQAPSDLPSEGVITEKEQQPEGSAADDSNVEQKSK